MNRKSRRPIDPRTRWVYFVAFEYAVSGERHAGDTVITIGARLDSVGAINAVRNYIHSGFKSQSEGVAIVGQADVVITIRWFTLLRTLLVETPQEQPAPEIVN